MKSKKKLSSKPVRKGKTYCSPACGRGCKWADYQRAHRRSKSLATSLAKHFGGTWHPRVWETLGWHYEVVSHKGTIRVVPYLTESGKISGYAALIGDKWSSIAATPKTAIREAMKDAKEAVKRVNKLLLVAMQDTGQVTTNTTVIARGMFK